MDSFIPFILVFEAGLKINSGNIDAPNETKFALSAKNGWSDDPDDTGGATMCGVTLRTYSAWCNAKGYPLPSKNDLKKIPYLHWRDVLKTYFWDKCLASHIKTKSIACIIVDWVWASGPGMIKKIQKIVGSLQDGIIGPKTIAAINKMDQAELFTKIKEARFAYIDDICRIRPTNEKYRKGWTNRLNAIRFDRLILRNPPE